MITHKFYQIVEKVSDDAQYRFMNEAFDHIMAQANE